MQHVLARRRGFIPGGVPRINWNDDITVGLVGCYLPSAHPTRTIYNLAGTGGDLLVNNGSAYFRTQEGTGLSSLDPSTSGASATAPPSQLLSDNMSLFWHGFHNDLNQNATNILIGLGLADGSYPYLDYGIDVSVNAVIDIGLGWNSGGTSLASATSFTPSINTFASYAGTFKVNGNASFYQNGDLFDATPFGALSPNYNGSDVVIIGGFPVDPVSAPNVTCLLGCIWNRVLTLQEVASLHQSPYRFLIWPEDEIFALGVKKAKTITSQLTANIVKVQTKASSLDSVLLKPFAKTASINSVLLKTVNKTASLDSNVIKRSTKTASLDAKITGALPFATLDALLRKTVSKTAGLDAAIVTSTRLTATMDLSIRITLTLSTSMDSVLFANFFAPAERTIEISEIPRTADIT